LTCPAAYVTDRLEEAMMARILFSGVEERHYLATMRKLFGRLQTAVEKGACVLVFPSDEKHAGKLEEQFWSLDDSSFLPHSVVGPDSSPLERLVIATSRGGFFGADVYVNFGDDGLERERLEEHGGQVVVYEFFPQDSQEGKERGRAKWNHYRDLGYSPERAD
jgi:DNA polymerase IIIc chi subunit